MSRESRKAWHWRVAGVATALLAYLLVPGVRNGVNQAVAVLAQGDLASLRVYLLSFGWRGPLISLLLMVLQALVLPLPAFVITFTNAWLYGWVWGALLSWSGAMLAACICFTLARWFGRPLIGRLVGNRSLTVADGFFQRYGAGAILVARLIPVVSFDLISYAAGLTSVGLLSFFWATGLGQLPATLVYSYLGQSLAKGAQTLLWGLFLAFGFVTLIWWLQGWLKRRSAAVSGEGEEDHA